MSDNVKMVAQAIQAGDEIEVAKVRFIVKSVEYREQGLIPIFWVILNLFDPTDYRRTIPMMVHKRTLVTVT